MPSDIIRGAGTGARERRLVNSPFRILLGSPLLIASPARAVEICDTPCRRDRGSCRKSRGKSCSAVVTMIVGARNSSLVFTAGTTFWGRVAFGPSDEVSGRGVGSRASSLADSGGRE